MQTKEERVAKGKQAGVANQETKDLPAKKGDTENQSPASRAEENEEKSN